MIWFDFGGVLSPPLAELYASYELKTGITPEQLAGAMKTVSDEMGMPPLAPVELASISEAEWGRGLARALVTDHPGIDLSRARLETFGEQWFEGIKANPVMMDAVRCLRESGITVGILSNNVVEWEAYWRLMVEPAGEIDFLIDSCKVGFRKPDPQIFRLAARTADIAPGQCVLVDDLAVNCEAAEAEGWRAVHFRDDRQALRDLGRLTGLSAAFENLPSLSRA
ncbi:HAD family hydrolase [Streptomyces lancefieldiae]|uniref:HAD family phosphatase n=1 Tax=Streptomyces lancefieldiae TaxID=3075520 RepID=A0ABU3AZT2_9ACTN|nr:HAD family phosphatase [Streptomyces sp. DSM 40712]MDT0615360.1 HAD family phosphatase [Streptomyces sp. DSM 40712]